MPAQSSMEGLAKLMAAKAMIGGAAGKVKDFATGDARAEKRMKKRNAKEKLEKAKQKMKEEDAAHAEWLRENGSYIQAIKDRMFNSRKILSAEKQGWADGDKRRAEEAAEAEKEAKIKKAAWISGRSRGEMASQLAHDDNVQREKELAEKKELHDRETQQRHSALALQLKKQAEFADLEKSQIIDMIKRDELAKELNEAKAAEIANEKQFLGGMETVSPDDPQGSTDLSEGAGTGGDIVTKLDEQTWEIEEIKNILGKGVLIDEAILKKDTEQANLLIQGLGLHSPPFLETLTKDEGAPSIVPESIGADSAPDVSASPDVSMETMLDGEPMPILSDQLDELLAIEREELDFDRRREAREIKADRRALEDRRDSKFKKGKGLFGSGKGKKPDKKKKSKGILSTLFKFGARYLLPMVSGWVGLKTVLGLSTKGDDAARLAKALKAAGMNADDAARIAKLKAADDAARAAKAATAAEKSAKQGKKIVKGVDVVTDISKGTSKSTTALKIADGVTDITKSGVKSTNLSKVTTGVDKAGKTVVKTLGTKLDKFGVAINNLPKAPTVGGGPKNVSGGSSKAGGFNSVDDAIKASNAPTTVTKPAPAGSGAGNALTKTGKVVINTATEAAKPVANTVKAILKTTKVAGKLAMNVSKYLAPLDMINKMGQGQGFWESLGNMGLEVGNLIAGAAEFQVESYQKGAKYLGVDLGEGGFSDKSASEIAFQTADIMGNEKKWQTSYLEQGINKGVAAYTGTEVQANKKVYTEEQEALATAAENEAGAVDVGFGQGDIEDLEALSLLDAKSLEALLAFQVWDDEDQKQIEDLLKAKQAGIQVTYDDGGWLGGEKIKYGGLDPNATEEQRNLKPDVTDMVEYVPEPGQGQEGMFSGLGNIFGDIFSAFSPDPVAQHKMAETTTVMAQQATTPGSIFTHDTHLENTLWTIWEEEKTLFGTKPVDTTDGTTTVGIEGVSPQGLEMVDNMMPVPVIDVSPNKPVFADVGPKIPSELLAQVISQISSMEKQAASGTQAGAMVQSNMNQHIDQSVRTNNLPASTVFAPTAAMPAGIGAGA